MKDEIPKIRLRQHGVIALFVLAGIALAIMDFRARGQVTEEALVSLEKNHENLPVTPIPLTVQVDEGKVLLGERLYNDPLLSHDNSTSCETCHDLAKGGTDQRQVSEGINGALGPINSPTTFNSGFFISQFWDGRAKDLAEQAAGPVNNPLEMGSNWAEVIGKLSQDPSYVQAFDRSYSNGIRAENITDAIAEYEKSLITPNCAFDRYLRGDRHALTDDEQDGYRLFREYGCISCHQGVALGGNMYQTVGVMEDYFARRPKTKVDYGRFNVTGDEWNRYQFKVPTLRNITITYPYLHDGSAENLDEVLQVMWKSQLGRPVRAEESEKIVKFLKTLIGTYKGKSL
jgi:cytochrome c peroxidase